MSRHRFIGLVGLLNASIAWGDIVTWTGDAGNGSWHTAGNWDVGLPAAGDDVVIPDVGNTTLVTHALPPMPPGTTSINSLICDEALTVSGGTLAVATTAVVNNTLTLTAGTLSGGTWDVTGGILEAGPDPGGTISATTIDGNVNLAMPFAWLTVTGGLTLNGTITLSDDSAKLRFSGTQTLTTTATAEVAFDFFSPAIVVPMMGVVGSGSTLTLAAGVSVTGGNGTISTIGPISRPPQAVVNNGTIHADVSGRTLTISVGSFTNNGTMKVNSGATVDITSSSFTNFAANTLTGGTYDVAGTLTCGGCNIQTNAAEIVLDGPSANLDAVDTVLTENTASGSFQIKNGASVFLSSFFLNTGLVTIGPGASTFFAYDYTQPAGTTTLLGGTLDAFNISGGTIGGQGSISGGDLSSNVNANVAGQTLQIESASSSDGALSATDAGILVITSDLSGSATYTADGGTLQVSPSGPAADVAGSSLALLNNGVAYVNAGVTMDLTGAVTIQSESTYQADPTAPGSVDAALNAGSLVVHCTGALLLQDSMSLTTTGDLVLDGVNAPECGQEGCPTPRVYGSFDGSTTVVMGNLTLLGDVNVSYSSSQPLQLYGNFDNQSTSPQIFDWPGGMSLVGTSPQTFEVAGADLGVTLAGFEHNFSMGEVEVAGGADVTFLDAFDNQLAGQAPCSEALYVHQLVFQAGAAVTVSDCRVYFDQRIDPPRGSASVTLIGCGQLVPTGDANGDGAINLLDFCGLAGCMAGEPHACLAGLACSGYDYDADGDVDLADVAVFESAFTGVP